MDELIKLVEHRAGVTSTQARLAVSAILGFLAARLPSPLLGRVLELMRAEQDGSVPDERPGGAR